VACSLDGRWGLSGGEDCVVRLWDLHSGEEVRRFEGHIGMVGSVSFRFPNRVISVGDHTARVWDMNDGRELCCSPRLPSGANCGTFFDFDGVPCILIGTERDGLYLWRVPLEAGLTGG
jgi:WD40 repeat protein